MTRALPELTLELARQLEDDRSMAYDRAMLVREVAATTTDVAEQLRIFFQEVHWRGGFDVRVSLARNPALADEPLALLLGCEEGSVRSYTRTSPVLTPEVIDRLIETTSDQVRKSLVFCDNLTPAQQVALLERGTTLAAHVFAEAQSTHPSVQISILDADPDGRYAVSLAQNPSLSVPAALRLLEREDRLVERLVAENLKEDPTGEFPAWWLARHRPERLSTLVAVSGVDSATVLALAPSWEGSLDGLLAAAPTLGPGD